jgi:hypothetical protein
MYQTCMSSPDLPVSGIGLHCVIVCVALTVHACLYLGRWGCTHACRIIAIGFLFAPAMPKTFSGSARGRSLRCVRM